MAAGGKEPTLTSAMRAEARKRPGQWLYSVDPGFDPNGEVPPQGIAGAWRIDDSGNVAEFLHNPNYMPSPMALGFARPANELENKLQLTVAGYFGEKRFAAEILEAELFVYTGSTWRGPATIPGEDGRRVIDGCTSLEHIPKDWPGAVPIPASLLLEIPGSVDLRVNPGSRVTVTIPIEDLRGAMAPGTSDGSGN
ncbi:type VII secretion system-associated protein [Kitasatospora sp. NPDC056651]|uniref:type VII secretion system-associated protein n=1 Tax=Kitasatospora sp. NPDC056651 TaxID=3345892 RepID=UPI00368A08FB